MCGIAGFIGFENNLELAQYANLVQKHRGPDNQSVWHDDHIALAHQRLSIIDLSERSNQPLKKGNLIIVFNGEIYNYNELKTKYLIEVNFETTSDTEVLLEMYKKFSEKCLDYFVGMFSFVIYDLSTFELFGARDHFGIKPFFFTSNKNGFAFASELKSLIKVPGFNKQINYKTLISSLNYLWIPGSDTMFIDCYKLPPAHYIKINRDLKYIIVKYWEIDEEIVENDQKFFVEKLKQSLEESIDRHMVSDVPISSFLSGGLDSSLISVLALKRNPNLSTYTIATEIKDKKIENMPADERYAQKLAQKFNFDHNEIIINADIVKLLPEMVRTLDEPIGDPAAINTFVICKAAKEKGVKVLLSGMGADEIFFGYRRMKATLMAKEYKKLPNVLQSITRNFFELLPVRIFGKGIVFTRWAQKFLSFASLPIDESYRMSYSYYNPKQLSLLTNHSYDVIISEIIADHSLLFNGRYKNDVINQMCFTDINMFMVGLNLTYTDRASMAASVEVRVPFIDKNVIELAMKIPGKYKYKNRESKFILKKVAEDYLPSDIIYRPKASFGAPIRSWISNELKPMVDELLSIKNLKKRGFLNANFVRELIENDRLGKEDNAYRIYQLLTLELWFKEYLDK